MMLSSELAIPFHTVLHQTKLNSTLSHRILFLRLASPEQHTLYVTLSSYLSSTIICPPQNPLAVLVLVFELLLCDIDIRILLKTFPGFMFGTTWSMDASTTSLQKYPIFFITNLKILFFWLNICSFTTVQTKKIIVG